MTKQILTTSGLLLPENSLFEVYDEKPSAFDSFVGRHNNYLLTTLSSYYLHNSVSYSPQASLLYEAYRRDKSFESFTKMVDFTSDVLALVECKAFMDLQAYNKHTPVITMALLRDLLTAQTERLHQYDNLTPSSRFIIDQAITKETGSTRYKVMMKGVQPSEVSWVNMLAPLMCDKSKFSIVFKYFFVNSF